MIVGGKSAHAEDRDQDEGLEFHGVCGSGCIGNFLGNSLTKNVPDTFICQLHQIQLKARAMEIPAGAELNL